MHAPHPLTFRVTWSVVVRSLQKSTAHANRSRDDALEKGDKVVDREKPRQAARFIGAISDSQLLLFCAKIASFHFLVKSGYNFIL